MYPSFDRCIMHFNVIAFLHTSSIFSQSSSRCGLDIDAFQRQYLLVGNLAFIYCTSLSIDSKPVSQWPLPLGSVPSNFSKWNSLVSTPAFRSTSASATQSLASKSVSPLSSSLFFATSSLINSEDLSFSLSIGDAFVICDAGGGTVDLISYEVEALTPRLKLKELIPGSMGMAGSLGLNKRFEEAVKSLIGEEEFFRIKKTKAWFRANTQFDREVKPAFRGKQTEEYFVNFPIAGLDDDFANGLESNCWRMTGDNVKDIFAPLITDIIRLIDDQVKEVKLRRNGKGVTGIFLVGGFGGSVYLKSCVEKAQPGIQVLQPSDAWSAIVKGAALSKLPQTALVSSTKATQHYGVEVWSVYDDDLDYGEKTASRRDGTTRVMTFTCTVIRFPFYRSLDAGYTDEDLIFTDEQYQSRDRTVPRHRSKGDAIQQKCVVRADFRSVDRSLFQRKIDRSGRVYYDVHYFLVVKLDSALMMFSCEADGETLAAVEATYRN
ncbi:hypothetical protein EJ04DRAFT_522759 [Polyplosphaeria fusca]|uniref:Uncharacterized protein n=1 Tax=Polyplosphaeria fusca TaxID=682080 RepID=A0A9P4R344_9PLEO|nr:hypothetical protein EJ04DRAFT_522759 [Polyplosphaeria fusca]